MMCLSKNEATCTAIKFPWRLQPYCSRILPITSCPYLPMGTAAGHVNSRHAVLLLSSLYLSLMQWFLNELVFIDRELKLYFRIGLKHTEAMRRKEHRPCYF